MSNRAVPVRGQRLVLEGVPRIGFDVRLCPFPGAVESILRYLKEPVDYDWIMGVTGACFRRTFNRDDGGNVDLMYFSPQPQQRVFDALGYELRIVSWKDKGVMLAAIKESLAAGRPVIACGIIGPPEAGIVAGYDKGGEVLIGYSYFQDRRKFPGYYEQPGWYEQFVNRPPAPDAALGPETHAVGVMVLGPRKPKPTERQTLVAALRWAIDLERTANRPYLPDHVCGLAAYDAWADALEVDADYPRGDDNVLGTRAMVYGDQCVMLAERGSAVRFLRKMAEAAPEAAADLNAAAAEFENVGKVEGLWPWKSHSPHSPEVRQGLADPATRRTLAAGIRRCRAAEAKAVDCMEKALACLSPAPARAALKTPTPEELTRGARWQVEGMPIPMAFRAAMNVIGKDYGREVKNGWSTDPVYDRCLAASGEAFDLRLSIDRDGHVGEHFRRATPAEVREGCLRMLAALSYDGEVSVRPAEGGESVEFDAQRLRGHIFEAIARSGKPVILVATSGDVAVVTGYEQDGAVLHGWTCNGGGPSVLFDPERRQELRDWFATAQALVVFKGQCHSRMSRVRGDLLTQAVHFLRRTELGASLTGPALYEAWAKLFEGGDRESPEATREHYSRFIDPVIWDLAERRHYARVAIERLAPSMPALEDDLRAATAEFAAIHDLMWKINSAAGGRKPGGELPQLADPDVRGQIAAIIREAATHDAKAADHIETVLENAGQSARVPAGGPANVWPG